MKKKKNSILIILIVIFALAIIAAAIFLVIKTINENTSDDEYNKIASSYAGDVGNETITSPSIDVNHEKNPIDFSSLQKQNKDIYSWIYIPETNINYPVCQSSNDDNFYLDHDIYGDYSYAGAIYSQVCNSLDYSDRVTVLYGHNMANASMFADLHKFEDSDFFNSNKYMYVYTPGHKLTYEVVSAFTYDDRHIMNSFDFSDDTAFEEYLDIIQNPHSISKNVREGINLTLDDKILTLSTCLNSGEGRYLVQGALVKDELTE